MKKGKQTRPFVLFDSANRERPTTRHDAPSWFAAREEARRLYGDTGDAANLNEEELARYTAMAKQIVKKVRMR